MQSEPRADSEHPLWIGLYRLWMRTAQLELGAVSGAFDRSSYSLFRSLWSNRVGLAGKARLRELFGNLDHHVY